MWGNNKKVSWLGMRDNLGTNWSGSKAGNQTLQLTASHFYIHYLFWGMSGWVPWSLGFMVCNQREWK